jgi:hypothetical protein
MWETVIISLMLQRMWVRRFNSLSFLIKARILEIAGGEPEEVWITAV